MFLLFHKLCVMGGGGGGSGRRDVKLGWGAKED